MTEGRRVVVAALAESPLEAIEKMTLDPQPEPAEIGPRDVVVAIESAQVGWVDLLMTAGQYQHQPKPPYTPGLEYAGTVARVGTEVNAVKAGDRVLVDGFRAGPRSLGAYQGWGGFASWAVVPEDAVIEIPGGLSFDQACNLLGNYETAVHCLITRGKLQAGETVLIHGASGATGLAAVHVAKLVGATVIATGRSKDKLAIVKAEGADHVIGTANLRDDVKAIAKDGVDVVYDGVGGDLSVQSMRCVKFGARFLIVGWASTPFVGKTSPNQLPTNLIMMKGLDVLGCPTVISTVMNPSIRKPRLDRVLEWVRAGKLKPHVSRTYPLDDFKTAMRAKGNGEIVGGVCLRP
ncbi:MAG TPA: NADPH:quinone oxidoreductase family protein [Polyangiaceae bacterium]|jgi:NADPH2:quinone reductase